MNLALLSSYPIASMGRRVEKVEKKMDDGRQKPPKLNGNHVTPVEGKVTYNGSTVCGVKLTGIYQDGFWVSAAPMEDLAKLTMPGPAYLCRPPWPSYLENLSSRDQVLRPSSSTSISENSIADLSRSIVE